MSTCNRTEIKKNPPLVSIITPTYNHEVSIGECIESVLAQTYSHWEQIIIDDGSTDRTKEIVAQYNDERIKLLCFLPKNAKPPFQTIIYFPGSGSLESYSSKNLRDMRQVEFFPKSGRAVIYPVYKGTYERHIKENFWRFPIMKRDMLIKWVQDFQRVVDYLETRDDLDHNKVGYYGFSLGGFVAPLVLANEERIKVGILYVAGLTTNAQLPEIDAINFAPRVTIPVLMLNGKYDDVVPYENSQKPLYKFLGTEKEHKKWIVYENGHSVPRQELIKESLSWLDKYLGPVSR